MSGLVFDIETTGFPDRVGWNYYYPPTDLSKYSKSRVVSVSYAVLGEDYDITQSGSHIIKRNGFAIPNSNFHGITDEMSDKSGITIEKLALEMEKVIRDNNITTLIAHNILFDFNVMASEFHRNDCRAVFEILCNLDKYCTCENDGIKKMVGLKVKAGRKYVTKSPKLDELYKFFFDREMKNPHDSMWDVRNLCECLKELYNRKATSIPRLVDPITKSLATSTNSCPGDMPIDASKYRIYTSNDLRRLCKERGINHIGKSQELKERLAQSEI